MNTQNQKIEDMTWLQKIDLIRAFSLFPAITVMVFMRRRLGLRLMKPAWLAMLTIIMLLIPAMAHAVVAPFGFLMVIFAISMLGLGLWHRRQGWLRIGTGELWHTYSPGESRFEALAFIPSFLKSHGRCRRFLDPAAVAVVALIIGGLLSHGLGIWLMFAAFFLYVYEANLHEKQLDDGFNTYDGMCRAKAQEELVKVFEGERPEQQVCTIEQTVGIPTGIGQDILRNVKNRQANRKAAPDNLATAMTQRA